jgi:hypothetical protein
VEGEEHVELGYEKNGEMNEDEEGVKGALKAIPQTQTSFLRP